jgi:predicted Zn-dependent protease
MNWKLPVAGCLLLFLSYEPRLTAQAQRPSSTNEAQRDGGEASEPAAEQELQQAIVLTSQGKFRDAIPHFRAVQGRVREEFAAEFNLALCYYGAGQPQDAIRVLRSIHPQGTQALPVYNLLAQSYVANRQSREAFEALKKAAALDPRNEKLYLFVADACMDQQAYEDGLKVVDLGLKHRSDSATLHYERGMFLTMLDDFDSAKPEFVQAAKLAPESDIGYIARLQQAMFDGNLDEAVRVGHEGVQKGYDHYMLLSLLGEALVRAGAAPGSPEFAEAKSLLVRATARRPSYPSPQITLGKLLLMEGRVEDALGHLEAARELDPRNPAIYATLAMAYRKAGDAKKEQEMLDELANLNAQEKASIGSAPGDRKAGYAGNKVHEQAPQ